MPKLRQVHEKMPEEREEIKVWYPKPDLPTLDYVRPYAKVAAEQIFGTSLENLEQDPFTNGPKLMKAFFFGSRARAHHMGMDTSTWPQWDSSMERLITKIVP